MGRNRCKKKTYFNESLMMNTTTYGQYYHRLMELAISMFEWKNLPPSVDSRFLELTLFKDGQAVFFRDEDISTEVDEQYLALQVLINGKLNVYRVPTKRQAFAVNGYRKDLTIEDSVIIYNNYLRSNSVTDVKVFAQRLYNLDRIIDVNANAQKTPVILRCSEEQRLTVLNAYKEFDGNAPVIMAGENFDIKSFDVLKTDAPYVADKIYQLKTQIWNEALTYLGITNLNIQKKERLVSDEVVRSQGGTIASRYSRLEARRQACKEINKLFGLEIEVDYREDFREADDEVMFSGSTGDGEATTMVTDIRAK